MLNKFLVFFFMFLSLSVLAQEKYAVSDNSNFFVVTEYNRKSDDLIVDIYSVARNRLLRRIAAPVERKKDIRKIEVSPDARYIALYLKYSVQVWDVASAYLVEEFHGGEKILFVEGAPTFLFETSSPTGLYVYDKQTQTRVRLRFSDRLGYKKVVYEPGLGCYFVQGARGMMGVIRERDNRLIKRLRCSDFHIDPIKGELTIYGTQRTVMRKVYSLPSMVRLDRQIPSQEILSYVISNDLIKANRIRLNFKKVAHSPDNIKGAFIVESKGEHFLFVYDYRSEEVLFYKDVEEVLQQSELVWVGSEKVRLISDHQWLVEYEWDGNIWKKRIGEKRFMNSDVPWQTYEKQFPNIRWSSNQTYSILNQESWLRKDESWVKENMYRNQDFQYPDCDLLLFSPNERYLFFHKDSAYGYVALEQGWDEVYYFSSDLSLQDPIQEYDTLAPDSFYLPLANEISFDSAALQSNQKIFAHLQSIGFDQERVSITVQILDSAGNIYTGLKEEDVEKVWCEIYLRKELGDPESMKALRIEESDNSDTSGVNVALVSDYSGSMGPINTSRLERGVKRFIEDKTKKDRITILKYDTRIQKEVANDMDRQSLLKNYNETKFSEMGGGTSLLDAANRALEVMRRKKDMENVIFLLTDGYENSSMATISEVIVKAKKLGIRIYTIGIGNNLNVGMLQAIAMNTGGSFTHCSNPTNLSFLYRDLKRKIQTSYTISFERPKEKVKYTLYVRLCHPACDTCASDFQKFTFDNSYKEPDLNAVDITNDEAFQVFGGREEIKKDEKEDIASFPKEEHPISFLKKGAIEEEIPDTLVFDLDSLEAQFEEFDLPHFEFELDTNLFVANYDSSLKMVAEFLLSNPDLIVEIQGHTDNTGSKKRNVHLSNIRAQKVAQLLIELGVPMNQLRTIGFGEDKPLYPNISDENRALNRRIEFELLSGI